MGNIEIKERPRRMTTIFGNKPRYSSRSPFHNAVSPKSPFYKDFSPIRYSPMYVDTKSSLKQHPRNQPYKKLQKRLELSQHSQRSTRKIQIKTEYQKPDQSGQITTQNRQNRQKCEQIIRKVRNFNDFLVELKKKLRENHAPHDSSKKERQVSLSVKLENERVQLQKYKKLVERELSKTHSIENISIQNNGNGEKILTIQYQDLGSISKKENQQPTYQAQKSLNHSEHKDALHFPEIKKEREKRRYQLPQQTGRESENLPNFQSLQIDKLQMSNYEQKLRQARNLWNILNSKIQKLGEALQNQQVGEHGQQLKDYLNLQERIVKVNQLYVSMESANRQSVEMERRIRQLLS